MLGFPEKKYDVGGKVVLLTGALGAIGRRLALCLAERGARLALVDVVGNDNSTASSLCSELNSGSGQRVAAYFAADLRRGSDIARMIDWAAEEFGHIDVLINNAGVASPATLYDDETFERMAMMLEVNLRAPIEATRLFVKHARETGRAGVVLHMASLGGLVPNRGGEVYGAAKAGLVHLTRASRFLAPQIRVCAVAPYYVRTPMVLDNPKLRDNPTVYPELMLEADQVCAAAVRCIEDSGSAGHTYALIGSWTYSRMWLYDVAAAHVKLLAAWALLMAMARRVLGGPGHRRSPKP
ncbi:hypothetical protein GGI04_001632 [Coemansia thaxteri]|uniref:Uncharacterized protein n=1 Tax=Coemansia thaxteri TaxID=2663907 RepID=A0A9W8BGR9_9FUNG|nr:hypothetical protein H4R26_002311 [Coemansia thaxteri]KAJ2007111.1 hypothetical protein GGI04_001632 [Coemansia thaxteri]KAJ2472508.1 hypothetical protein GGI02_001524 [Coemansia sp. RSA 2322]KAJ2483993.1 hypothetical protein EV174_002798 [Coemansia sp. RSA 2320]